MNAGPLVTSPVGRVHALMGEGVRWGVRPLRTLCGYTAGVGGLLEPPWELNHGGKVTCYLCRWALEVSDRAIEAAQ